MKEYESKRIYILNYFGIVFVSALCLMFVMLFESHKLVPFVLIGTGVYVIIRVYMKDRLLMTPISIFSLIWLILTPICSFEYPLMREMSNFEWEVVLEFIIAFSIGAIFAGNMKMLKVREKKPLTSRTKSLNYGVLILAVIALIAMFISFGGIPLFQSDANVGKDLFRNASEISDILNLLSYFGSTAILVFFLDDINIIKNKNFLFLALTYMGLLILSGERFFVTILIILCMFSFCKTTVDKEFLKKILFIVGCVLAIFIFILQFRGNAEQKEKYFINTGIYRGDVKNLVNTEFFRYLGMQERVLTRTFEKVEPGMTKGTLTLAPIIKIFGLKPIPIPDVQIYGYTAKTIITKVYADFGHFWMFAVGIISFIINFMYIGFSRKNSILSQYITILWLMFLLFSFYAYFDNLILFFLHFTVYILFIETTNNIKRR